MRNMKKIMATMMAVTMAASVVGCGSTAQTGAEKAPEQKTENKTEAEAPKTEEKAETAPESDLSGVTISLMASQDWIQDAEMELGKKFTEETGINVDYQIIPSDQYESLLMTKLNSGECADIYCSQSGRFDIVNTYNVEVNALPLSDESWAGNVEKEAAAELSVNGVLYGQPIQDVSAVWAIAYNISAFDELGLSIPTNYEEFKGICEKILEAGKTPIYECVSDGWHHTLWVPETGVVAATKDPSLVDALNNNKATFEENETLLTIYTQIKEMIDNGYWGEDYMSNEYANTASAIASGDYLMTVYNQGLGNEVNAVDSSFSADNIGYFVIPLADNQTLNMNAAGPSRFVYSGSKNAEAAKKYLEFMASDDSLAYMTENVGKFNHLPYTNAISTYSPVIQEFYDRYNTTGTVLQTAVKYVNPQWMEIGSGISALALGEVTPQECLKDIDKLRAEQAAAAGDANWE